MRRYALKIPDYIMFHCLRSMEEVRISNDTLNATISCEGDAEVRGELNCCKGHNGTDTEETSRNATTLENAPDVWHYRASVDQNSPWKVI